MQMQIKLVEVVLGGNGIIHTGQLQQLIQTVERRIQAGGTEGIILSGRLPVWVYGALVHHFHPRPFVATFEPRMGKGVIVASHVKELRIGDLIGIDDAEKIIINFPEAEGVNE